MSENAIIISNLKKSFKIRDRKQVGGRLLQLLNSKKKEFLAIDDISFKVKKGSTIGILGLNGSGKTTLLRLIVGIYSPSSGTIQVNGKLAPILNIGTGFHRELSAEENIVLSGMLYGMSKEEIQSRIPKILEFAELEQFSEMKLKHYSSGMRARLAFSTVLEINPDILLVDEILSVGDIRFRKKSFEAFSSIRDKGKTILYSTHSLEKISELCDEVLLLDHGKLILKDKPELVIAKYKELAKSSKSK